jgi:hypothetical protein
MSDSKLAGGNKIPVSYAEAVFFPPKYWKYWLSFARRRRIVGSHFPEVRFENEF